MNIEKMHMRRICAHWLARKRGFVVPAQNPYANVNGSAGVSTVGGARFLSEFPVSLLHDWMF